jgi:hypothetical protein
MARIVIVLLVSLFALAGSASASILGYPVSSYINEAGEGSLIANSTSNPPGETWTWEICDGAGEACRPLGSGRSIRTGSPPAGTTFRAISNTGVSGLSPVWNGPLRVASPPTVAGTLQANQLVTPVAAVWEGGWVGDEGATQLSVCPSEADNDCTTLTDRHYSSNCPSGSAVIDPAFAGLYLRVASEVYGPNMGFDLFAVTSPYGGAIWAPRPTIAVAIAGRIPYIAGRRTTSCGPPPIVAGLPAQEALGVRAAWIEPDGLATVRCEAGCTVALRSGTGRRAVSARAAGKGEIQLRLPRRKLLRLGRAAHRYTLLIDGHQVAQLTVSG